jgi:succinate-semialdehyde dehydrogenase / glutarate-semialdehyde dehydrogenase
MTRTETAEAISHALTAFKTFRNTVPRERARMLRKWYDLCQTHATDIAKLLTWENGKALAEAKAEVTYGSSFFEWFSEEAPRIYGDVIPSTSKGNRIITLRQPIGVVGIITPWNFPMGILPLDLFSFSDDYKEGGCCDCRGLYVCH